TKLSPARQYSTHVIAIPIVFNVFSAQILSLKPEIHSRNEDKLCVKQLKKTAIVQFILRW
ncbi:hypothetical protein, partial [Pseudomonas aeruginosa]|uniref:hypothetical protein n=1 Tax=Pseudomonas aeruginosa TaxID=287 RepID=UPI001F1CCCFE